MLRSGVVTNASKQVRPRWPRGMPSRSSVWFTRLIMMMPWPSATQPGARCKSGGTAYGSSATRSSAGTGWMPGRRSRPRSGSTALPRRGNRQPGWRARLALAGRPSFRRPVLSPRLDGDGDIAQRQTRFRLIGPGCVVKFAQQIMRGPPHGVLALRAELVSCGPAELPLRLCGHAGATVWCGFSRVAGSGAASAGTRSEGSTTDFWRIVPRRHRRPPGGRRSDVAVLSSVAGTRLGVGAAAGTFASAAGPGTAAPWQ
jgi:hypothetical protein